ncbi:hypothetical protein PIB30_076579 [Stylosanthes scabra]|uniref:Potassium channel n=1 Tax=Stylosanthes scabra TaxID=79078 RepID=A0ABU6WQ48_9FABA|nr:hypothetical protein [Stylosanthes scabra]
MEKERVLETLQIIVSGEAEFIDYIMEKDRVLETLQTGDMFGEVGALYCRPQSFIIRTMTLTQLLKLKTSTLIETMQVKKKDNIQIFKNFLQHYTQLMDLSIRDLMVDSVEEEDHDIGDSKGKIPLHIAASNGHEDCATVMVKHTLTYIREMPMGHVHIYTNGFSVLTLNEMMRKRKVAHQINVKAAISSEFVLDRKQLEEQKNNMGRNLIRLPDSSEDFTTIAGLSVRQSELVELERDSNATIAGSTGLNVLCQSHKLAALLRKAVTPPVLAALACRISI